MVVGPSFAIVNIVDKFAYFSIKVVDTLLPKSKISNLGFTTQFVSDLVRNHEDRFFFETLLRT